MLDDDFYCFDDQRKQGSEKLRVIHYENQIHSLRRIFSGLGRVKYLDLQEFDFNGVTDISGIFESSHSLESINFGEECALKPRYCQGTFLGCTSLKSIDTEHIDMSNNRTTIGMFQDCYMLEHVKLNTIGGLDCRQTQRMFAGCENLESFEIDHWDQMGLIKAQQMFYGTKNLERVNMQDWKHDEWVDAAGMFKNSGVREIKLGAFGSDGLAVCMEMFQGCRRLVSIDYENLSIDDCFNIQDMFNGCDKITELSIKINAINAKLNEKDTWTVNVEHAFQCMKALKKLTVEINDQDIDHLYEMVGMDESLEELTVKTNQKQELDRMINVMWLSNIRKIELIGITVDSDRMLNKIIGTLSVIDDLDKFEEIIVRDSNTGELIDSNEIIKKAKEERKRQGLL